MKAVLVFLEKLITLVIMLMDRFKKVPSVERKKDLEQLDIALKDEDNVVKLEGWFAKKK